MTGVYGTPFQETEALLAVQSDDIAHADHILHEMMEGELSDLREACYALSRRIDLELERKRKRA